MKSEALHKKVGALLKLFRHPDCFSEGFLCNRLVYILFRVRVYSMASSCEEYRYQQQLLALKKRLAENKLSPKEREEIERLVQELERKLKI